MKVKLNDRDNMGELSQRKFSKKVVEEEGDVFLNI